VQQAILSARLLSAKSADVLMTALVPAAALAAAPAAAHLYD
jgi:hypothetical protein